jgi:hypothetical protein
MNEGKSRDHPRKARCWRCTFPSAAGLRFSSVAVLLGRAEHLFAVVDRPLLLVTDGVPPILTGNVVIELL